MQTPDIRNERGIALAMAVFALVIIGALVAGTFFAGRLESAGGVNAINQAKAFEAAEAGTAIVAANWLPSTYNNQALGTDNVLTTTTLYAEGRDTTKYRTTITKVSTSVFLVRTEGMVSRRGVVLSRRLIGRLMRIQRPNVNIQAALTVYGSLTLGGSAQIDGTDRVPAGWGGSCQAAGPMLAGIRSDTNDVRTSGNNCRNLGCVTGNPQLQVDPTLNPNEFSQFGDVSFDDLAAMATKVVSGTVTGIRPDSLPVPFGSPPGTRGVCNTATSVNWGEPHTGAGSVPGCFDYFPIIYAPGDVRLSGGRGQGILLVRGDLDLSGGVEFYGPVIVLGEVRSTGTGGHVYGGLMSRNASLDPSVITGNSLVNYSGCAVTRALNAASGVTPLNDRSWAQLY